MQTDREREWERDSNTLSVREMANGAWQAHVTSVVIAAVFYFLHK